MDLPLSGVKVIDMTTVLMGPYASQLLGDMGADVIKIESPKGDLVRDLGPMKNPRMGSIFLHVNRSKRSLALDVKNPAGLKILSNLIKEADVLLYNIRPQSMARLNLSYEEVAAINQKIIYVGTFGFGQGGRYKAKPAYDDLIQGAIGIPSWIQQAGSSVPRYVPSNIIDRTVGLFAASSISAALYYRQNTGKGQRIDVPMYETMISHLLSDHIAGYTFDPAIGEPGYGRLLSAERKPYETKDGYICAVIYNDKQWESFYKAIGRWDEIKDDPRYASITARNKHILELHQAISKFFKEKTTKDWLQILNDADIPCITLHDLHNIFDDPHLQDVGLFKWEEHPSEGRIRSVDVPTKWSVSQPRETMPAPLFGQHSIEVLRDCGYSSAEIDEFIAKGIVYADHQLESQNDA